MTNQIDENCKNCGAKIMGKYCYSCGQNTDLHHRSIFHLMYEALEGIFHFDGRLWRTLPAIFIRPGSLNKDYIEGRINRHVPPFRLFLVSLFIFIITSEFKLEKAIHHAENSHEVSQKSDIDVKIGGLDKKEHNTETTPAKPDNPYYNENEIFNESGKASEYKFDLEKFMEGHDEKLINGIKNAQIDLPMSKEAAQKFKDGLVKAASNPKLFIISAFSWAHKLAILLLPINAIALAIVYIYKRKYYIYDHLLVSMTMMSFVFLSISLSLWLPAPYGGILYGFLFILTPINFFFTLKGTYDSGWLGAFFKTLFICAITTISFSSLILLIMGVAAYYS